MVISGNLHSGSYAQERARAESYTPLLTTVMLAVSALAGTWPCGLILGRNPAHLGVPYGPLQVLLGEGDGVNKSFVMALSEMEPGSLSVTDGTETFTDDGCAVLTGSAGGTGRVNYQTGLVRVTFNAAPGSVDVAAIYTPAPVLVLDQATDPAQTPAALCIQLGAVRRGLLKVGAAQAAPDVAVLRALQRRGIVAV